MILATTLRSMQSLRLPVGPIGGHAIMLYSLISFQGYASADSPGWPAADGAGLQLLEVMRNHRQEGAIRSLTQEFPGSVLWVRNNYFQIQNLFQLFSDPDPGQKLAAKGFLSEHKTVRKPAEYSLNFSNNMLHGFDHFYILVAIHFTIIHQSLILLRNIATTTKTSHIWCFLAF